MQVISPLLKEKGHAIDDPWTKHKGTFAFTRKSPIRVEEAVNPREDLCETKYPDIA